MSDDSMPCASDLDGPTPDPPAGARGVRIDAARSAIRQRLFGSREEAPRIGRFAILRLVGVGGMGSVFSAYDERLERKVALKLLRRDDDDNACERILREAKAMARLRHANVVQIYEVGEHGSELFIAMEFVDGRNLLEWRAAEHPSWQLVVEAFVQAGRGLAAAHAAGLVHGDFKPDNVMIESRADGSIDARVLDFGLARRSRTEPGADARGPTSADVRLHHLDVSMTDEGKRAGTPAYMAPEQILGSGVDARADQFAWCVALWEALFDRHPFGGTSTEELFARVVAGTRTPAPGGRVPRRIVAALERGLEHRRDARWPVMDDLLRRVEGSRSPRKRRGWWAGLALAVVAVATAWATRDDPRCRGAAGRLHGIWDEARRTAVRAGFLGTGVSFAESAWAATAVDLDRYATDWIAAHTEVCEATTLRGDQTAEVMRVRMSCLDRARTHLAAVTDVLAEADPEVVGNAVAVVARLSSIDRCRDLDARSEDVDPPSPADHEAVESIMAALARADAERAAGRYDAAAREVADARRALEGVTYEPVHTSVALVEGQVQWALGRYEDAEASLRDALTRALGQGSSAEAQEAAVGLMQVLGLGQERFAEALQYREIAEGLAAGEPAREGAAAEAHAAILEAQGEFDAAIARRRDVLSRLEATGDADPLQVARLRARLGQSLMLVSELESAETEVRRALDVWSDRLGDDHPTTNGIRLSLGNIRMLRGDPQGAEDLMREVLERLLPTLGAAHVEIAGVRTSLAIVLGILGRLEEAEIELREALAIREAVLHSGHGDLAKTLIPLAHVLLRRHEPASAEVEARRAVVVSDRTLGADHALTASAHALLGEALLMQDRLAEAEEELARALEIYERVDGSQTKSIGQVRSHLGACLHEQGRYAEAEAEHRAAVAAFEALGGADHSATVFARHRLERTLAAMNEG